MGVGISTTGPAAGWSFAAGGFSLLRLGFEVLEPIAMQAMATKRMKREKVDRVIGIEPIPFAGEL